MRQLLEEGRHFVRSKRAVQSDHERTRVRGGIEKRFHGLPAQRSTGAVRHCARDDQRYAAPALLERVRDREKSRLRVQSVEDGLDEQEIDAALEQAVDLVAIAALDLVEGDGAEAGIVHVRRERGGDGKGTKRPSDEAPGIGTDLLDRLPCEPRRGDVHLVRDRAQFRIIDDALKKLGILASARSRLVKEKFVQADGGGAEGIGLEHVGAGLKIFLVHALDCGRAGEEEQFVRAFEVLPFPIAKTVAAIVSLAQVQAL